MILKDEGGYNASMPSSPIMSPLKHQIKSINTALSMND